MPKGIENKCIKRLDKKNSRHKKRHKTLCAALARNGCLTKKGNLRKTENCSKMNAAVNIKLSK